MMEKTVTMTDEEAVAHFRHMLQFETVSASGPENGSYDACAEWLKLLCKECGFEASVLPESKPHKPIVIAEWYSNSLIVFYGYSSLLCV
jgi:acetylornithine deacetylase/succinyl-diaminopimelate desuccinylase-like protein